METSECGCRFFLLSLIVVISLHGIAANLEADATDTLNIIGKEQWGGKEPSADLAKIVTPIPNVVIAHTATANCITVKKCSDIVKSIQTMHMQSNKWSDIAYNFLIGEDGNVYVGRGWDAVGATVRGYNQKILAIAVIGNFNDRVPSDAALAALKQLMALGVSLGKLQEDYGLLAHSQLSATLSPGDAFGKLIRTWPHWVAQAKPM